MAKRDYDNFISRGEEEEEEEDGAVSSIDEDIDPVNPPGLSDDDETDIESEWEE